MTWKERLYSGLGIYLRSLGLDCVDVLDFDESAWEQFNRAGRNRVFFETKITYRDHNYNERVYYEDRSFADLIKRILEEE